MPSSIDEIQAHLTDLGINHQIHHDVAYVPYTTTKFTNTTNQKKTVIILVGAQNEGEVVRLMVPYAYKFPNAGNSYNKLALMQTLLQITYSTKLMQFEYDPDQGEIRITVDIPVMDSRLTHKQLSFCLECIVHCLDTYHDQILDAMRHGLTPESDAERLRAWEDFKKSRAAERRRERESGF
jgi:hypothetical protein